MKSIPVAEANAIARMATIQRKLIWITAKRRDNGNPVTFGFWSDHGTVNLDVRDALTGATVSRQFVGSAGLTVGAIESVADLSVRTLDVELSGIHAQVEIMFRQHDLRFAPAQVYVLTYDTATMIPVAAASPVFVGFVEEAPIKRRKGAATRLRMRLTAQTRELSRVNQDVRSHESQIAAYPGDRGLEYIQVMGTVEIAWGSEKKPIAPPQTTAVTSVATPATGPLDAAG